MQWVQTALAAQIYNASADYVLALKANHPTLHGQVEAWFEQAQALNLRGLILATTNGWKKEIIVLKKRQVWTVPVAQLLPYINKLIGLV